MKKIASFNGKKKEFEEGLNDKEFDPDIIKTQFMKTVEEIKSKQFKEPYSLKKAYFRRPIFDLRRNFVRNNSSWLFRNFYNDYYCYCVGNNCFKNPDGISQTCKFLYYIVIIDKERYAFPKTDYIFVDFFGLYMAYQEGANHFRKPLRDGLEVDIFGDMVLLENAL